MAGGMPASRIKASERAALGAATEAKLPKWVLISLLVHGVLIVLLFMTPYWPSSKREPPPSYVVDLVGGERIGGKNFGTKLVPETNTKPRPAELPSKANPPPPPEPVKKEETKAEKPPQPEKTEKAKPKPAKEVVLATKKIVAPRENQKKDSAEKKPAKQTKEVTRSEDNALEKVRERLIQSAIERARSRVAVGQGSPSGSSDSKGEPLSAGSGEGLGAQSLGKGGVGGEGVLKSIEYIRYFNSMQATLKSNWAWAGPRRKLKALVRFGVKEDGEIVGVKITQSSGEPLYDESVIRAVKKSSPLPAPPENYRKEFSDVEFSFEPDQVG
jgi:colicin import membrane protein